MYADIIVDISHDKLDRTFEYRIPKELESAVKIGVRVNVPFGGGNRLITGYVIDMTDNPKFDVARIKDIASVIAENVPIEGRMIQLAAFIRKNYGGSMNQALKTVIPVKETVNKKRDVDAEDSTLKIIDATELAKTSYTEYSRYVAAGRSYPQVIDGAKSSYRRAIYGMYKGQGQKKMKVADQKKRFNSKNIIIRITKNSNLLIINLNNSTRIQRNRIKNNKLIQDIK